MHDVTHWDIRMGNSGTKAWVCKQEWETMEQKKGKQWNRSMGVQTVTQSHPVSSERCMCLNKPLGVSNVTNTLNTDTVATETWLSPSSETLESQPCHVDSERLRNLPEVRVPMHSCLSTNHVMK